MRSDNLVVVLSYSRAGAGAGIGDRVERDAIRMAREVLHSIRKHQQVDRPAG